MQLKLLMAQGADRGYFLKLSKSLAIAYNTEDKGAARWEFEQAGLNLN